MLRPKPTKRSPRNKKLLLETFEDRILCNAAPVADLVGPEEAPLAAPAVAHATTAVAPDSLPTGAAASTQEGLSDAQRAAIADVVRDSTEKIFFEKNVGQFDEGVRYGFKTKFGSMMVLDDSLRISTNQKDTATGNVGVHVVDITFPGSGNNWQIVPGESSGVAGSYHVNGTTLTPDIFTEITLEGVFNGVDLRLYSAENGILEFDWLVGKAQDYSQIRMLATGQDGIIFNEDGSATLDLRFQDLALKIPEVYQVIDGAKHAVGARMVAGELAGEIRYELSGNIIPDQPLVIDPSVAWSSYFDLDTTFDAYVFAAAVNANGVYAIGWVGAIVTNAAHGTYMQVPAGFSEGTATNQDYIYRFDNTGTNITAWTSTQVVSSTGTVSNQTLADQASDLELFPDGRVLAAFTSGRVQIYSANLGTQQYSSEPIGVEVLNSVAIVSNDVFYTSGRVNAALAGVPVTGPDTTMAGTTEGYIIRFSGASTAAGAAGLTGDWATYIGGDSLEYFTAISVTPDKSKIVFATVSVVGAGYSGLVNAVDSTLGGAGTYEILTGVFNEQAAAPAAFNVFSYFGGSANEGSVVGTLDRAAVQVAANNTEYYIAGNTNSTDLPAVTAATGGVANGAQTVNGGGAFDMFATLVPLTGSAGSGYQATYLGGAGEDNIGGIAYDSRAGKLLVFGTSSGSFPTQDTSPAGSLFYQGTAGGGLDIVVGTLSGNLQTKEFATYIGGTSNDYLGQTGELVGQGHIVYSEVTGLAYLATTVHSALSGPVMGLVPGKDKTKSNAANDSHFIIAFNANTHDFGDAPTSYDGGNAPSEAVTIQLYLGSTVDAEASPFTSANADGDDLTNSGAADDEDALVSASPLYLGASTYSITVPLRNTNGAAATLNGWIDFNSNGAFEVGEFATDVVNNGDTTGTLTWSVPTTFTLGQSFMRLRLSNNTLTDNAGTAGVDERSIGLGVVGEIEDYAITFAGATVSGTVYRDNDNNGVIGGTETGIGGVSILLTGTNDLGAAVSVTTSTLADGTYSFTGLRPSNGSGYTVTETQPVGFLDGRNTVGSAGGATTNNPPTDIISGALVTTPGLVASGYNFGELNPASLSGFVYADVNGNGTFGAGETGIPGATVTLTGTNDLGAITPIVTTTNAAGAYTFSNLRPGTYVITETQPVNYNDGGETLGTGLTAPNSAGTVGADVFTAITFASVASGNEVGSGYNFGEAPNFNPTKSLQTTSDAGTTGTNVAIGEVATFRLVATIPAGGFTNFQLQDVLPLGYQFINGSAVVGLVSAAGQLTSTTITAPLVAIGTPSVALGDLAVSSLTGSNDDNYLSGTDVFFKLGDLTNADTNNATTEYVVIEFQARVLDVVGNTSGTTLGNTFNVLFDTNNTPLTAETFGGGSNTITTTVVEPRLQITKASSDTTPDINALLTFTLTISHTGTSTQPAYDIRVFDALPTGLTIEGVPTVVGATATSSSTAGNTLDITLDSLAVAGTATITFTARVTNSLATVGTTIDNNARLYWDSLAADEANNAIFNNAADGTPDRDYGAVFGTVEAFAANTDNAQDTERLLVNTNSITGVVYEDANNSGGYNVGEPLLSGVQLTLSGTTASGLVFSQNATTNGSGVYTFTGIPAGASYTITETPPPVYSDGAETAGTPFGGTVSAVPGVNTITNIAIAADSAQSGTGYNFGELLVSSISGTVYRDNNNNGAINGGETGIGTITVRLTGIDNASNPVNRTTTTAADGTYSFGNVVAGTYAVSLDTQPAGFLDGTDTAGTSGGTAGAVGTDSIKRNHTAARHQRDGLQLWRAEPGLAFRKCVRRPRCGRRVRCV